MSFQADSGFQLNAVRWSYKVPYHAYSPQGASPANWIGCRGWLRVLGRSLTSFNPKTPDAVKLAQIVRIANLRPCNAGNPGITGGPRAGVRPRAPRGGSAMVRHGGGGRQMVADQGEARTPDLRGNRTMWGQNISTNLKRDGTPLYFPWGTTAQWPSVGPPRTTEKI